MAPVYRDRLCRVIRRMRMFGVMDLSSGFDGGRFSGSSPNAWIPFQCTVVFASCFHHETKNASMRRICVFPSSRQRSRPEYQHAAEELAAELVRYGMRLGCGGGSVGLMGILVNRVLASQGEAIGVIPEQLVPRPNALF